MKEFYLMEEFNNFIEKIIKTPIDITNGNDNLLYVYCILISLLISILVSLLFSILSRIYVKCVFRFSLPITDTVLKLIKEFNITVYDLNGVIVIINYKNQEVSVVESTKTFRRAKMILNGTSNSKMVNYKDIKDLLIVIYPLKYSKFSSIRELKYSKNIEYKTDKH